jgi:hypothetical protein
MKRTLMATVAAVLLSSAANAQSSCAPIGGLIGGLVNGLNQQCQVERQQARAFEAQLICTRAGFPPNHPQYGQCLNYVAQARNAAQAAQFAASLAQAGAALQAASPTPHSATCIRAGNVVTCNGT